MNQIIGWHTALLKLEVALGATILAYVGMWVWGFVTWVLDKRREALRLGTWRDFVAFIKEQVKIFATLYLWVFAVVVVCSQCSRRPW